MSKKTVLKWLCVTATICSLHAGVVTVAAEDAVTAPPTTDNAVLTSETATDLSTAVEGETVETAADTPSETAAQLSSQEGNPENTAAETPVESPELAKEYSTDFEAYDDTTMAKADWWNGNPFGAVWKPDKVAVEDGVMTLTIDEGTDASAPVEYISGELRTQDFFHYGTYTVTMKPIKNPGTVSSFFTYTGPSDNNPWDEVDIEFLGKDTTKVQFNYYTDGHGEHEYMHDLGFDAADAFHTYAFDWQKDYITWYVDGLAVYTATENIPVTPGRIMMNAWPGTGVDEWLQPFDGKTPLVASYDSFNYKATEPAKLEQTLSHAETNVTVAVAGLDSFNVKGLSSAKVTDLAVLEKLPADFKASDVDLYDLKTQKADGSFVQITGEAVVSLPVDASRKVAKVIYFLPETGAVEELPFEVNQDGKTVSFKVTHFSNYGVVYQALSTGKVDHETNSQQVADQTGTPVAPDKAPQADQGGAAEDQKDGKTSLDKAPATPTATKESLPKTGAKDTAGLTILGALSLLAAFILMPFGKKED